MKKFISMVMAAAMVVSLVPATAFAAECKLKVAKDVEWTKEEAKAIERFLNYCVQRNYKCSHCINNHRFYGNH